MQHRFSATEMSFKISGKKREIHFEYLLLHDIVAKSLCAKAGSYDSVTCEKFEFMTAISAGISMNWGRILFQRLLGMVQNSKNQSRGYTMPINILLTTLIQAHLEESVKLHSKKVLTSSQETVVNYPKKRKHKDGGKKKRMKKVTELEAQTAEKQTVEERRPIAPTHFDPDEVSEPDSCPLVTRRCRQKQEGTADDQMVQGSGGNYFEKDLEFYVRKEHEEQQDQEFTADERENSGHDGQMGDNDPIANPGFGTQLDSVNPIANDSGAIHKFTADERENSGHDGQMGDNDPIANPGFGTQLDSVNPIAN
ncbi:hypothetical protein F511_35304 [Dorcoceras hygrometricum]|uniref:Uncharacterized protein n=1 Tax=Dorcoceras hygrometricum TaxID=472368 RepID=A0A2Z7BQT5_9LAMI|nr:hypothetical protein F511_35304 [Dorcoceras hygrometricum]